MFDYPQCSLKTPLPELRLEKMAKLGILGRDLVAFVKRNAPPR